MSVLHNINEGIGKREPLRTAMFIFTQLKHVAGALYANRKGTKMNYIRITYPWRNESGRDMAGNISKAICSWYIYMYFCFQI